MAAARDGQLAIVQLDGDGPHLQVRIGVHTGKAVERDGNYFGPVMNGAGRVMEAAHGRQVLVSGVTADLVANRPPDGRALRDLGTHEFRGLSRPERLFQLVHPELDDQFPAPRAKSARPLAHRDGDDRLH